MADPTIQDVFGAGATQTATTLTASATNGGEAVAMGIVLKLQTTLTTAARDADLDRSLAVERSFDQIVTRTVGTTTNDYYQSGFTVTAQKLNAAGAIDADDY
jgi:hypothetical protein